MFVKGNSTSNGLVIARDATNSVIGSSFWLDLSSYSEKDERSVKTSRRLSLEETRMQRCQICSLVSSDARAECAVLLCHTAMGVRKRDRQTVTDHLLMIICDHHCCPLCALPSRIQERWRKTNQNKMSIADGFVKK